MIFVPIARERIPFEWERIIGLIGQAIERDPDATPAGLYRELVAGRAEAFWIGVPVHATGIAVTTTTDDACFINYVAGTVEGGPRKFIQTARDIVAEIETLARDAGCTELRGGGRNWSRVFPEWEHYDPEHPNRIRKRLS